MPNFLGRVQTFLFGAAIGRAASDSVTPVLEPVRQHAWEQNQNKLLDPGTAAQALAQGIIAETEGQFDANRSGIADNRFGVLWRLAQRVPGIAEARTLRRRSMANGARAITLAQLHHVYAKEQIEPQYWDGLDELLTNILSAEELAAAIHRGLVPDPAGLLKGQQPEPPFNVESYPVYPIDAEKEAAGSGINLDRLGVKVGLQGLPMGPHEAAQAEFRGIITFGDYIRAFNESNNRNEWARAIYEQTRQIPTARDFFENALRGYHDLKWAQQQAKRHGMSDADSLVIYQNQGRPMNIHAIQQALARGAKFNPEPGELTDPFDAAIVEGNLKPGYYEMAKSLRYTLPSVFTMRALAQAGVWDEAKTALRLKWAGWFPQDADEAAHAWVTGSGSTSPEAQREKLAVTQAIAALKKQFLIEQADGQTVLAGLELLGVSAASAGRILETWTIERGWTDKPLTPSQIKKAYSANTYTLDVAVAKLEAQHFTEEAANTYLTT